MTKCKAITIAAVIGLLAAPALADFGLEALYRTGDAAPGGGVFDNFDGSANINASGTVAFYGVLVDGRRGIWRGGDLIARVGDLLPDGLVCTALEKSPSITNSGVVGFWARNDSYDGVYSDTALLDYLGRDLGGGRTLGNLYVPWINNPGSAIYWGANDLSDQLTLRDQTVLRQEGDPAPGGGTYGYLWRPVHNDAGQIAFRANIDGDKAICTPSEVLARLGQATPIGGTWADLPWGAEIDSTGLVAWWGLVDTGSGTIEGFFTKDGAIVKEGDLAPNGMVYTEFYHLPSSNANGDWIFSAGVEDPNTGYTISGIFTLDEVVILDGDLDPDGHEFYYGYRPDLTDEGWFSFYGDTSPGEAIYRGFIPEPDALLGDLNCDGLVDFFDIDPFVMAITDPAGYVAAYPDCDIMLADCNGDGIVDFFDIDAFVALVVG